MKVIALNGSPHKKGNTFLSLQLVCDELKKEGIRTEIVQLAPLKLQPCTACFKCAKTRNGQCHGVKDDGLNDLLPKIYEADGLLIGSPTWFANVTGHVKNLIDRAGLVSRNGDYLLARKVGAAVVAVRRAGSIQAFDAINHFYNLNQVIIPGTSYWNMAFGLLPNDSLKDEEGVRIMQGLGQNMAWLLHKLNG